MAGLSFFVERKWLNFFRKGGYPNRKSKKKTGDGKCIGLDVTMVCVCLQRASNCPFGSLPVLVLKMIDSSLQQAVRTISRPQV
jgi:hypothetical protein